MPTAGQQVSADHEEHVDTEMVDRDACEARCVLHTVERAGVADDHHGCCEDANQVEEVGASANGLHHRAILLARNSRARLMP